MKASINLMAQWTGVDRRTIAKRLADLPSEPGPNRAKMYETPAALRAILCPASDGDRLDPQAERALLDRARREQIEVKLAAEKGELIPATDYERALSEALKRVATQLESLPDVLERDAGIGGEAVERCIVAIDQMREDLYRALSS